MAQRPVQLNSLTGLRWLAAVAVFAFHIRNVGFFTGDAQRVADAVAGSGDIGVSFFFVLSGFVLARSARPGDTARRFWRRRVARIYPAHLLTALLALLLGPWVLPSIRVGGVPETLANLALIAPWRPDWNHGLDPVSWSLACEAFFYALFPVLFLALRRMRTGAVAAVAAGSVALVTVTPWLGDLAGSTVNLAFRPWARLPEFVLGVALGLLVSAPDARHWRWPAMPVAVVVTASGYAVSRHLDDRHGYAAATVIGVALLICAAARTDLAGRLSWLASAPMVRLGELSYGFYLLHILVIKVVAERLVTPGFAPLPAAALTVLTLAAALGLSWLLYELVEVPGRRLISTGRWSVVDARQSRAAVLVRIQREEGQ